MTRRIPAHGSGTVLVAIVLLTACSNDTAASDGSDPSPSASENASDSSAPSPTDWSPIAEDTTGLLPAGRLGLTANGRPDAPWAVVEVPRNFTTIGGWVVFDEDPQGGGGVGYWTVSEVVRDPCSGLGDANAIDAGDTVEQLVAALQQQRLTRTTAPAPVSVDGYDGLSLEVHVPKGIDVADCPSYNVWESDPAGARHMSGPGEFDRLWILDVEGEVVVLSISVPTDTAAPETAVERLTGVVDSTEFVARE